MLTLVLLAAMATEDAQTHSHKPRTVPTLIHKGRKYYCHEDGIYRARHPDSVLVRYPKSERPPEPAKRIRVKLPQRVYTKPCFGGT